MTRREWLKQNPPPKPAASLRALLERLNQQNQERTQLVANRHTYSSSHVPYWNQELTRARAAGDVVNINHATQQLADVQKKIADIDEQLKPTAEVPTRLAEIQREIGTAAKCPSHNTDLMRHGNRPDDLFICENGPHFFLWTKTTNGRGFVVADLTKPLPDLDKPMEWI